MRILKTILVVAAVSIAIIACKNKTQPEVKTVETEVTVLKTEKILNPDATFVKSEFAIDGMTCEIGCARAIEKEIAKMDGVKSAKVDFGKKLAMVEYDQAMVNHNSLEITVTKTGDIFKVSDMKTVAAFSVKKECEKECKKECCKVKAEKTD